MDVLNAVLGLQYGALSDFAGSEGVDLSHGVRQP
jgi:hypothetical protein